MDHLLEEVLHRRQTDHEAYPGTSLLHLLPALACRFWEELHEDYRQSQALSDHDQDRVQAIGFVAVASPHRPLAFHHEDPRSLDSPHRHLHQEVVVARQEQVLLIREIQPNIRPPTSLSSHSETQTWTNCGLSSHCDMEGASTSSRRRHGQEHPYATSSRRRRGHEHPYSTESQLRQDDDESMQRAPVDIAVFELLDDRPQCSSIVRSSAVHFQFRTRKHIVNVRQSLDKRRCNKPLWRNKLRRLRQLPLRVTR